MKILNLKFKNLNSLYGEWNIDFTHDSYLSDGIFAITGPTGAGKSTILDAICLALYGVTPRLQRISSSVNDIMSRSKGECYSEIIFKTSNGTYLVHWAQHRARKKFDGKLADSTHEISNLDSEKLLSNKKNEVKKLVEEITGMDLERFTRSTLLAQGSFSAFLKADSDEKSKILQQITGTEIYTKISKEVHNRKSSNDQKLKLLEAQIGEAVILPKEEEAELKKKLGIILEKEKELNTDLTSIKNSIQTINSFHMYKEELEKFEDEKKQILDESKRLEPIKEKLLKSKKALSLEPLYIKLNERELNYRKINKELEEINLELPKKINELELEKKNLFKIQDDNNKLKDRVEKDLIVINKVRAMDLHIGEFKRNIEETSSYYNKLCLRQNNIIQRINSGNNDLSVLELELSSKQKIIQESLINDEILTYLPDIKEKAGIISSNKNKITSLNRKLDLLNHELKDLNILHIEKKEQLNIHLSIIENLKSDRKELLNSIDKLTGDSSIKEIRREKEFLIKESLYINKIIRLEDERANLQEGKPCPLCGSLEHPYSNDEIPSNIEVLAKIDSVEKIINKYEEYNELVKNLETEIEQKSTIYSNFEKELLELKLKINGCDNSIKELSKEKDALLDESLMELDEIRSYGLLKNEIDINNFEKLIHSLEEDVKEWNNSLSEIKELDKKVHGLSIEIKSLEQQEELLSKDIYISREKLEKIKSDLELKQEERFNLFGSKSPNEEDSKIKKEVDISLEKIRKTSESVTELEALLREKKNRVSSLKKEVVDMKIELDSIKKEFDSELKELDFIGLDDFKTSKLSKMEIFSIEKTVSENENSIIDIDSKISDRSYKVKDLSNNLPEEDINFFNNIENELDQKLKSLREELGGISQKLEINKVTKDKFKEKEKEIKKQKKECESWSRLHSLIGSADGKKFRNFAQGLTFEIMVSHANKQLSKMSDRYLLVRDSQMPLELNVIDNYIGGESRTSRNLSGGETFIVSLALALGLSSMSSNKVQVDSLFLDEGFGTLDKDSLDIALDTLSALHQDGKIIGIISHVPTIKERIPTQIEVQPISGGRSRLFGPGCFNS